MLHLLVRQRKEFGNERPNKFKYWKTLRRIFKHTLQSASECNMLSKYNNTLDINADKIDLS
jgi:hypothetical protein